MLTGVSREDRLAAVAGAAVAIVAGVNAIEPAPLGVFYDDAHYVVLAKALATGEGFRYINLPGAPAGTHFPPGYPAFLALLWRIAPHFPENVALFRMANAILLGIVALAVYWLARARLNTTVLVAAFTAVASTAAVPALLLSSNVMSETLFLALLIPLLVVAEGSADREGLARPAMLGLGAAVLCLVRTHGIALVPAIAIGYAVRRRWRAAAVMVLTSVVGLLPWLLWVRHHDPRVPELFRGQYGSYTAWLIEGVRDDGFGLIAATLRDNLATIAVVIARSFSVASTSVLDWLAIAAVLTLLVAGGVGLARRAPITLAFTLMYVLITLVWPFSPLRFLWGVWPLFVILFVSGVQYLWTFPLLRWSIAPRAAAAALALVVLLGAIAFNVRGYVNAWWATPARDARARVIAHVEWAAERTKPDDVIASADEGPVYLYTGRRGVPVALFTARQFVHPRSRQDHALHLERVVREFSPTYVVAWTVPTQEAASVLAAPPLLLLSQIDTVPMGRVFRTLQRSRPPSN